MNESRLIIAIKGRLLSIANLDFTTLATALSDDIPTVDGTLVSLATSTCRFLMKGIACHSQSPPSQLT